MKDTICAISTPPGLGAIALIRLSGEDAFSIASTLFSPSISFEEIKPQFAKFAEIFDNGQLLDQVVVTKFATPRSFTGENMVEISCHGSIYIQKRIIEMLIEKGCRMANPGEFTQRAFVNGKMDLPQAEAIADLIDSQTETSHRLAVNQLSGHFSKKIEELRKQFVHLASLIELELDFSEEDVEFADRTELTTILNAIQKEIHPLIDSFKIGNALKNGIPTAIVGKPNVGKSTLLNAILQQDRAIVSDIPGTTRDTIEDTFIINGTLFRFIDTAGLRQSDDTIENFGIQRTHEAIEKAAIILYLFDVNQETPEQVRQEMAKLRDEFGSDKQFVFIANKIDTLDEEQKQNWQDLGLLFISAKQNIHITDIKSKLVQYLEEHKIQDQSLLTNERHYDLLNSINGTMERINTCIKTNIATDLLAEDVRMALYDLGQLTGTISSDDILNNIFGHFCIGK